EPQTPDGALQGADALRRDAAPLESDDVHAPDAGPVALNDDEGRDVTLARRRRRDEGALADPDVLGHAAQAPEGDPVLDDRVPGELRRVGEDAVRPHDDV